MLKSREFLSGKSRERVGGDNGLSPLAPVILGLVPRILLQRVPNLVNKLALLNKCWGGRLGTFSQSGRSMIEMLGVLAIIAVLSVGGIAGYSKAMEKFKLNKAIEAYSYLVYGILEHVDDVKKLAPETPLADFVQAINAAPNNWEYISAYRFSDNLGNVIQMRTINGNGKAGNAVSESYQWAPGENVIVIDFFLGGFQKDTDDKDVSQNFSDKLCTELFTNVAYPLHAALINAHIYQDSQTKYMYWGDRMCKDARKCLSEATISDFNEACKACTKNERCCLTFQL